MKKEQIIFTISLLATAIITSQLSDLSQIFGIKKILIRLLTILAMASPLLFYIKVGTFNIKPLFSTTKSCFKETSFIIIFLVIIGFIIRIKTIAIDEKFFTFSKSNHYGEYGFYLYLFSYTLHSFLQEILARGLIISGMIYNFPKLNKVYILFITSIGFGIAHFYFGFFTIIITTISGLIFGIIYLRQKNIWGVSLIHYIIGLLAISFGWA